MVIVVYNLWPVEWPCQGNSQVCTHSNRFLFVRPIYQVSVCQAYLSGFCLSGACFLAFCLSGFVCQVHFKWLLSNKISLSDQSQVWVIKLLIMHQPGDYFWYLKQHNFRASFSILREARLCLEDAATPPCEPSGRHHKLNCPLQGNIRPWQQAGTLYCAIDLTTN